MENRDPYLEWFALPAGETVTRSDYPSSLWMYETARRLHDKLGLSLLDLEGMDPVAVDLLDHIARCEDAATEQSRVRAEQSAQAAASEAYGPASILTPSGMSAREFLHGRRTGG